MKRKSYERRLRAETVRINGCPVIFYKCPKRRKWCWRAIGGRVQLKKGKPRCP